MKYMLLCNTCGTKHFTDGNVSDLVEVKSAPLPRHANGTDKDTQLLTKRFKCYKCGNVFRTIELPQSQTSKEEVKISDEDFNEDNYLKKWENEMLKSIRNKK